MLTFFIASCLTLRAITLDIQGYLKALGEMAKSQENHGQLKRKLCEFITLHEDAKRLSSNDFFNIIQNLIHNNIILIFFTFVNQFN